MPSVEMILGRNFIEMIYRCCASMSLVKKTGSCMLIVLKKQSAIVML